MNNKINCCGVLELNEDNDYIVNGSNISEKLNYLYMKKIPASFSLFVNGKNYTTEECVLQKRNFKGKLWDLYADDLHLENKLFNSVGKAIDFEITVGKVS